MSKALRITGGRVIDPSQGLDRVCDLYAAHGRIVGVGEPPPAHHLADFEDIDAVGLIVTPGLIDMHVHFREPGGDTAETIWTGTRAALEGGFTGVASMPDTDPAIDNQASAVFVGLQASRAGHCHVWPVGAVTKGRAGEELAEMGGLVEGGAVAFTDSPGSIANADIMRRALEYSQMFDRAVLSHPEVSELVKGGIMHEGAVSARLGMPGMPAAAEEILIDRDLRLAAWTGGRLHLQNVSCAGGVASIRRAKEAGQSVTAEVCPHHLVLTDESLGDFDSNFKVRPPLRTSLDQAALLEGLRDGTIDVIASGHAPIAPEQKLRELDAAPFGVIGLETVLPVVIGALIETGRLTWPELVRKLSTNPARVLGLDRGTLKVGAIADITLIDPEVEWTIDPRRFQSKSRNCPFAGWKVRGKAKEVIVAGIPRLAVPPPTIGQR